MVASRIVSDNYDCNTVAKLLTGQWSLNSYIKSPSFRKSFLYFLTCYQGWI